MPSGIYQHKPMSEETKKKISLSSKGKKLSEEHKKNISLSIMGHIGYFTGKHHSEESKQKISYSNTGRKHTEEFKEKCRKRMIGDKHFNFGKHLSEETKKKIGISNSISQKGKHLSDETKQKISLNSPKINQGKCLSEETKLKISLNRIGKCRLDKHPNWQGGKSFEPYTPDFNEQFKESIRARDNYCCCICNKHEYQSKRRLAIHHIDYNKLNSFPQNCIALCLDCHILTNINRKNWTLLFQSLLKERYGYEYTQDQKIILDFI